MHDLLVAETVCITVDHASHRWATSIASFSVALPGQEGMILAEDSIAA